MTQKEVAILSLLKTFLEKEISFTELNKQWIELYIEGDDFDYVFEDHLCKIGEFIYWGSQEEPSQVGKLDGVLSSHEVRLKISAELNKCLKWAEFIR